jgi:hypothetical protein
MLKNLLWWFHKALFEVLDFCNFWVLNRQVESNSATYFYNARIPYSLRKSRFKSSFTVITSGPWKTVQPRILRITRKQNIEDI